jgi:hypothetical protein
MSISIQKKSEAQRLKCEKSFTASPEVETNEEMNIFMKDPDAILSVVVLLLACLALAALANVFV